MELTITENPNILKENEISPKERLQQLHDQDEKEQQKIEREKKSHFRNFAQINRDNLVHIIKACDDNPKAVKLLMFLLEHMNHMNALVCSYKVFEEQLDMPSRTISRAIKYLKDKGFIYVYKSGTTNVYVMNSDLAWTTTGDKLPYCKFPAEVILSASEQDEVVKARKLKFTNEKIIEEE